MHQSKMVEVGIVQFDSLHKVDYDDKSMSNKVSFYM